MKRVKAYLTDIYTEMTQKVSWPTWEELQGSLVVVSTAILLLTFIVWVMNEISNLTMTTFYQLFR
ncbi:MAG: preprotein translocase subunit SecE [Chitinophagales bacterium]|nr:preprotein translocase subunit SecE [Chitinophagales bacterium]MDW8394413.1 preprotein translocase subunit SecE [Chitinophagales bacterium]